MNVGILGIGTAVPERSIAQEAALELARSISAPDETQARLLPVLYRRTNVKRRGSVLLDSEVNGHPLDAQSFFAPAATTADMGPGTAARLDRYALEAPRLGSIAARDALATAGLSASQVTHIVTVSCTGFMAPGLDAALIRELGLSRETQRAHIGFMGCHGAINGLRVAAALAAADPAARILLVAVELCSLHFHYGAHPERMVANALFADGAAAAVIGPSEIAPKLRAFGSCIIPNSEDAMTWRIGDHGFEMTLSSRVPDLLRSYLPQWFDRWVGAHQLSRANIASWAIHPGGPRILSTVAESLELPDEALAMSRSILAERGNMSSPTVLFIVRELLNSSNPLPIAVLGFGPGLVAEGAIIA